MQFPMDHLDEDEKKKYLRLLEQNQDIFSLHKYKLGKAEVVKRKIRLTHDRPIHSRQFRIPLEHEKEINDYVDQLLLANVIKESISPYNSAIFVVRKKDGNTRIVLDYRQVNFATMPDKYAARDTKDCIDSIGRANSSIFSAMDMTMGFWQLGLEEDSKDITAFTVPGRGRFGWERTPMGLHGATSSFARAMDITITGVDGVITYVDDVIAHSKTHDEQREILKITFQ